MRRGCGVSSDSVAVLFLLLSCPRNISSWFAAILTSLASPLTGCGCYDSLCACSGLEILVKVRLL